MILLLSIAPGIILSWDWNASGEGAWLQKQIFDRWYKSQDALADRFFQASGHEFWCREAAQRFKRLVQSLLIKYPAPETAMLKAVEVYTHTDSMKAEFIWFNRTASDWKVGSTCKVGSNYLLKQLFRQISAHHSTGNSELSGNSWEQRLKSLFGKMVSSEFFMPSARLRPVPVIFQGQSYFLAWDLIIPEGSHDISAGFFLLQPSAFVRGSHQGKRIIDNWHIVNDALCGPQKSWPAIFSLLGGEARPLSVHPNLGNHSDREAIQNFFSTRFPVVVASGSSLRLNLPAEMVGKAFRIGDKIGRLCYSDPVCGFVSMLVADMPMVPVSHRLVVAEWYFRIIMCIWVLFAVRAMVFRRLPAVGINLRVWLWFLAFAAFPAGLTIGSQAASLQEFREVKVASLHRDMHQQILHLETEMAAVSDRLTRVTQKIFGDSHVTSSVYSLPKNPSDNKQLLIDIQAGFRMHRIEPAGILIVTQGGWCFSLFEESRQQRFGKSCRALFGSILDRYLKQVGGEIYENNLPTGGSNNPEHRVSSISSAADFRVQQNFGLVRDKFESVANFESGNEHMFSYFHQVNLGARPFAVVVVLFNPEQLSKELLRIKLPEQAVEYRRISGLSPDIAVYNTAKTEGQLVVATGRTEGFDRITRLPVDRTAYLYDNDYASIMVPSNRLPGYVFVARLSAWHVEMQVIHEQAAMIGSLALLLMVVLLGSFFASYWIGKPLRDFIPDLEAIRNGRSVQLRLKNREDELASTALSIRRMSDWVAEREKIKKFVAPQAISEVMASNFIKAGAGTIRKVIILVSDIRSFTTISEEHPAEEVFDMVNSHLGSMAEVIQKWGGVIDRFVGDAVWAIFYEDGKSMAAEAVAAAIEMKRVHEANQVDRSLAGKFTVRTGTGLARGEILAGIMGNSGVRLDYTVVGKTLQDAEEAESSSKLSLHSGIIVTQEIRDELSSVVFAEIQDCKDLFEVIGYADKE